MFNFEKDELEAVRAEKEHRQMLAFSALVVVVVLVTGPLAADWLGFIHLQPETVLGQLKAFFF